MNCNSPFLSVIIITRNEADNVDECLKSVAWADEIIVVDAESTDSTPDVCQVFGEENLTYNDSRLKIFVRPWPGFAAQKQFALEQAGGEWVLSIDADERVTPELAEEIRQTLNASSCEGYFIPRRSTFLGKFILHSGWYPGHQLRLFRRKSAKVIFSHVHEGFEVNGTKGYLKHDILHYTHRTLEESLARMNLYSTLEAKDRAGQRVHWWALFFHPLSAFWNKFIAHQGWRDGMHGLALALVTAMVKLSLYLKLWEAQQGARGRQ